MKRRRLDWLNNQIVAATFSLLPRETRRLWKGNTAIDATFVRAPSNSSASRGSTDHAAGWYVRDGDHNGVDGAGKRKREAAYGNEATIATMALNVPGEDRQFPLLATGVSYDRPGKNLHINAHSQLSTQ